MAWARAKYRMSSTLRTRPRPQGRSQTIAADKLQEFVDSLGLPVLGYLRQTQNYIHLAARGLTVFDVAPGRVERDLAQWEGVCRWLDN